MHGGGFSTVAIPVCREEDLQLSELIGVGVSSQLLTFQHYEKVLTASLQETH